MMSQLQLISAPPRPRVNIGVGLVHKLADRAEQLCGLKPNSLQSVRRTREISWARFAVMKVARERGRSLCLIARAFGDMDHTSVLHGVRRADELASQDQDFSELVNLLRKAAG